jgi:hypothetical protein
MMRFREPILFRNKKNETGAGLSLPLPYFMGLLKKAASGVPCLRRSGFAQAGRHFSILTYSAYAPRVEMAAACWTNVF